MEKESIPERTKVIGEILSTKFEEIESRALGTVKLLFEPQFTRYRNLAA